MTATIHWRCLTCPAAGTTTGTESGPDVRHVKASQHVTTTSLREWAADGSTGCVGDGLPTVGTARDNWHKDTTTRVGPGPKVLATPVQGLADRKDTTDS